MTCSLLGRSHCEYRSRKTALARLRLTSAFEIPFDYSGVWHDVFFPSQPP